MLWALPSPPPQPIKRTGCDVIKSPAFLPSFSVMPSTTALPAPAMADTTWLLRAASLSTSPPVLPFEVRTSLAAWGKGEKGRGGHREELSGREDILVVVLPMLKRKPSTTVWVELRCGVRWMGRPDPP